MSLSFAQRWESIQNRVAQAAHRAGRSREGVTIVGVSKKHSAQACEEAFSLGIAHLGENYVAEWTEKARVLSDRGIQPSWHFIGALQSKKAKHIVGKNVLVHSLDRLSLASALEKTGQRLGAQTRCLIQVNASADPRKGGIALEDLPPFLESLLPFNELQIEGLMCIPAAGLSAGETHRVYASVRKALEPLQQVFPEASSLSMGMSNDFEIAVQEGATHIRVGTALFGPRVTA